MPGTGYAATVREPDWVSRIRVKWEECKPRSVTSVYAEKPSLTKPCRAGAAFPAYMKNGLLMLRFVRFLAGLSGEVILDNDLNDFAQHGAVFMAGLGRLTHVPTKPKDMEQPFFDKADKSLRSADIFSMIGVRGGPTDAVISFLDDSDETNISRVAHRFWVLNPCLGKTGFGYAEVGVGAKTRSYVAIQVFDASNTAGPKPEQILWPSEGYFPSSLFSPRQAWSAHLRPEDLDLSKTAPRVRLVNSTRCREWLFRARTDAVKERFFAVANASACNYGGYSYVIIFRPDGVAVYGPGEKY